MKEPIIKKYVRVKLGNVFEIPLPDGRFVYGRVYDDAGIGIYDFVSDCANSAPIGLRRFMFHVGIYDDILKKGVWRIVGADPFDSNESKYPPPSFIEDPISGEYSIYHQGEIRPSTSDEIRGLEETAVWDAQHIIERIMSNLKPKRIS